MNLFINKRFLPKLEKKLLTSVVCNVLLNRATQFLKLSGKVILWRTLEWRILITWLSIFPVRFTFWRENILWPNVAGSIAKYYSLISPNLSPADFLLQNLEQALNKEWFSNTDNQSHVAIVFHAILTDELAAVFRNFDVVVTKCIANGRWKIKHFFLFIY